MLRISASEPAASVWEIGNGARITFQPLDTIAYEAAGADARRLAAQLRDGVEALAACNIESTSVFVDGVLRPGVTEFLLAIEYGVRSIVAWEGIGDDNGNPVEPTREWITALCRDPQFAHEITYRALGRYHRSVAEGNGSASLPNGAAKEDVVTAPTAAATASPAPSENPVMTASSAPS